MWEFLAGYVLGDALAEDRPSSYGAKRLCDVRLGADGRQCKEDAKTFNIKLEHGVVCTVDLCQEHAPAMQEGSA